jgi:putative ABC transport system permease protein
MSVLARVRCILEGALRRGRMEREMEQELRFHVAKYTEDLVRRGVPEDEAARRARVEFGHLQPLKEECREARGLRLWDELVQDLRYAGRVLRSSPGFALVAVFTLALGIGANTAIFSVVNAWVLKPLPYANPDRLVAIWSADVKGRWVGSTSAGDLEDWRKEKKDVFEDICGWWTPAFTLQQGDDPEQVSGARVNVEFFRMLGAVPQLGRGFLEQESQPGAPRVVVLSHELWMNRLGGDPALVGKTIQIDGAAVTVVGIMPDSFHVPLMGPVRLWVPAIPSDERRNRNARIIARLKPGISLARATEHLKAIEKRLGDVHPDTNAARTVIVRLLRDEMAREGGNEQALIAFWLVGCVLLLACANVANLVVGRSLSRQKEMAVRLAIGAGRGRLLRQLLTENLAMFLTAALLSVAFAVWGVRWIAEAIPADVRGWLPNYGNLHVDTATLCYTLGIGLVTGLLFGLAPAFHCWRLDVNTVIKENAARHSGSSAGSRVKNCLIVFETSLALVVLVAAGLLAKGLVKMYARDLGFKPDGLITARMVLSDSRYSDPKRIDEFKNAVLEQARTLPGVRAAAIDTFPPYGGDTSAVPYAIDGRPLPGPADRPFAFVDIVSPDYFETMGIPVMRGRAFTDRDRADSPPVVVINQTMAQRNWPNQDPLGQRTRRGINANTIATVVGVVGDTSGQDDLDTRHPQIYFPCHQSPSQNFALILRTSGGSPDVATGIRRAVNSADKSQAVLRIESMEQLMIGRRAPFVIVGQVASFFAVLSLFLAALGIYAVMAYSVAVRKQEFGIRLALGAAGRSLILLVVRQGLKLTVIGLVIGLAAAFGIANLMSSMLYQVSPTDAQTFTLISLLLLAVAVLACYLPARRAVRIDPTRALRYE